MPGKKYVRWKGRLRKEKKRKRKKHLLAEEKNMSKGMIAPRTRSSPFSKGPTPHWVSSDHVLQGKRRQAQKENGIKSQ